MAERKKIGLREVRALGLGEIVWDTAIPGFGARRQKGEAVAYVLKYRTAEGRQRWFTIGRHGAPWTPDEARDRAREILVEVTKGTDPSGDKISKRHAASVADLCDLYFEAAQAGRILKRDRTPKRSTTLLIDRGRIDRHIKPLIGSRPVAAVTRDDVEKLLHEIADGRSAGNSKTAKLRGMARVKGGQTAANRVIGLLGAIFAFAVQKKMRPDNPVRGVRMFADHKKERRLSDDEYQAFGSALMQAEGTIWPPAIKAARMMAVSGWRRGEVLSLTWSDLDLRRRTAILSDTKTGRSIRPLSLTACAILKGMTQTGNLVFPATRGTGPMTGFPKFWARIAKFASLPADITPHTLRHSFSSLANDLGYSEATIAALVGHKGRSVTSRYVHSADAVLLAAADSVANKTMELMGERTAQAVVVPLMRTSGQSV